MGEEEEHPVPLSTPLSSFPSHTLRMLSVVVPAYNEGATIQKNLVELDETLSTFHLPYEIIVVNDGSTDNTLREIETFAKDRAHVRIVSYSHNNGKGHALIQGVRAAEGTHVAFVDADLEIHPRQLKTLLDTMEKTGADVVIGSKRHPASQVYEYPHTRVILSHLYHFFVRLLFGLPVSDTQAGLKVCTRAVIEKVYDRLSVRHYAFDLEFLVQAYRRGFRIVEAPIVVRFSRDFQRIKVRDVLRIFKDTLAVFFRVTVEDSLTKKDKEMRSEKNAT